jgi:hypothetical protein
MRKTLLRAFAALFATFLILASCNPDNPEPVATPVLKSIAITEDSLIIAPQGKIKVDFTVTDADAEFDADATSPGFAVSLMVTTTGKESPNYKITWIQKLDTGKGQYRATITDLGVSSNYCDMVKISIVKSSSGSASISILSDNYFYITSEGYNPVGTTITGLPVVYVNTKGGAGIYSKETWVDATISIDGAGMYDDLTETAVQIRGHGNTTWYWSKKPYALKFEDKTPLLGMLKHKRWILLANLMDRTLMRNAIAYDCGQATSLDWTPHYRYCELMLNGKHIGNYVLIEQVRVDKNRLALTEMKPSDNSEPEITGGYLFELDFHFDNDIQWYTAHGIPCAIKYPDSDEITSTQTQWAKDYMAKVENVLYSNDYLDSEKGYRQYIDLQSFVDYWLIYELMINHELANPGSVYMHKDRSGKLAAGPIWDFDWGPLGYNCSPQAKGNLFMTKAIWYSRITDDPDFWKMAKDRWAVLKSKFIAIEPNFDSYKTYLEKSAKLNFQMWNPAEDASMNNGSIINGDENLSFDQAVARAKSVFVERITDIDACLARR